MSLLANPFLPFLRVDDEFLPGVIRARNPFRPAHLLRFRTWLPSFDLDERPEPSAEHGDPLPGSGDVYVYDGFGRDPRQDAVLVDELAPPPEEPERRPVVRGPLEFDREVEIYLPRRRGRGEERRFHVWLGGEPPVVVGHEFREARVRRLKRRYPPSASILISASTGECPRASLSSPSPARPKW